jgi:hypothetical protein
MLLQIRLIEIEAGYLPCKITLHFTSLHFTSLRLPAYTVQTFSLQDSSKYVLRHADFGKKYVVTRKVNIKFFLCLIKHHAKKTFGGVEA